MFFSGFQKLKLCVNFLISRDFFGIHVYKVDIAIAYLVYQVRKRVRSTETGKVRVRIDSQKVSSETVRVRVKLENMVRRRNRYGLKSKIRVRKRYSDKD